MSFTGAPAIERPVHPSSSISARYAGRSRNSSTRVSSIHIAAGAAREMDKVRVQQDVCFMDVVRRANLPFLTSAQSHTRSMYRLGQVEGCQKCAIQPRTVGPLCIPCDRRESVGPRLRELNADGSTFKSLRAQFLSEWESSEGSPSFAKAYEIILPRDVRIRHDQYRSSNPKFEEVRSFHSSQCICDLGFKDSALCSFKSCGICCPIKSSFKSFAFGAPANKGR